MRNRNKRSVALDIKSPEGLRTLLALAEKADILIGGFRPGVAERLGLGPEACLQRNSRLV
ncbi:MAG TPA: CoA transferase [Mycoplana sp.]|nr:CoA transferase [Mycoplana sp.]